MNDFKPPRSEERVQGTMFPAGAWGKAPIVPHAQHIKQESGSEASPDSTPATLNRRDAEMGFGDDIPKRVLGRQP